MGGQLLGRLWPRNDEERSAALDAGYDLDSVLTCDDLCAGDDGFFSATGVTDGDVLQGVHYRGAGATTESLVMRSRSGTVRRVHARHDRAKLRARHRRTLRLSLRVGRRCRRRQRRIRHVVDRQPSAKRPTRDSARSSRASERRKPCVTSTWMRDCVML